MKMVPKGAEVLRGYKGNKLFFGAHIDAPEVVYDITIQDSTVIRLIHPCSHPRNSWERRKHHLLIEWGDGKKTVWYSRPINSGRFNRESIYIPQHEYTNATPGTKYTIKIKSREPLVPIYCKLDRIYGVFPEDIYRNRKTMRIGDNEEVGMFAGSDLVDYPEHDLLKHHRITVVDFGADLLKLWLNTDMTNMFKSFTALKRIQPNFFNGINSQVTTYRSCFEGCYNLLEVDENLLGGANGVVENTSSMFKDCITLNQILNLSIAPRLTTVSKMYSGCIGIGPEMMWQFLADAPSLTNASYLFNDCNKLGHISDQMFANSKLLEDAESMLAGTRIGSTLQNQLQNKPYLWNMKYLYSRCMELSNITQQMLYGSCGKAKFPPTFQGMFSYCGQENSDIGLSFYDTFLFNGIDMKIKLSNTAFKEFFKGSVFVSDIPEGIFIGLIDITRVEAGYDGFNCDEMFMNIRNELRGNIEFNNIFIGCNGIESAVSMFEGVTIDYLSGNIFAYMKNMKNASKMFRNTTLNFRFPDDIFKYCTKLHNYNSMFEGVQYKFNAYYSIDYIVRNQTAVDTDMMYMYKDSNIKTHQPIHWSSSLSGNYLVNGMFENNDQSIPIEHILDGRTSSDSYNPSWEPKELVMSIKVPAAGTTVTLAHNPFDTTLHEAKIIWGDGNEEIFTPTAGNMSIAHTYSNPTPNGGSTSLSITSRAFYRVSNINVPGNYLDDIGRKPNELIYKISGEFPWKSFSNIPREAMNRPHSAWNNEWMFEYFRNVRYIDKYVFSICLDKYIPTLPNKRNMYLHPDLLKFGYKLQYMDLLYSEYLNPEDVSIDNIRILPDRFYSNCIKLLSTKGCLFGNYKMIPDNIWPEEYYSAFIESGIEIKDSVPYNLMNENESVERYVNRYMVNPDIFRKPWMRQTSFSEALGESVYIKNIDDTPLFDNTVENDINYLDIAVETNSDFTVPLELQPLIPITNPFTLKVILIGVNLMEENNPEDPPYQEFTTTISSLSDLQSVVSGKVVNRNCRIQIHSNHPIWVGNTLTEFITEIRGSIPRCYLTQKFGEIAPNVQKIEGSMFYNLSNDNFDRLFKGCTELKYIPENLFVNNTKVKSFVECFAGCTSLIKVGDNLIQGNKNRKVNIQQMFSGCTGLKYIGQIVCDSCTGRFDIQDIFRDCRPDGIWMSNTDSAKMFENPYMCIDIYGYSRIITQVYITGSSNVQSPITYDGIYIWDYIDFKNAVVPTDATSSTWYPFLYYMRFNNYVDGLNGYVINKWKSYFTNLNYYNDEHQLCNTLWECWSTSHPGIIKNPSSTTSQWHIDASDFTNAMTRLPFMSELIKEDYTETWFYNGNLNSGQTPTPINIDMFSYNRIRRLSGVFSGENASIGSYYNDSKNAARIIGLEALTMLDNTFRNVWLSEGDSDSTVKPKDSISNIFLKNKKCLTNTKNAFKQVRNTDNNVVLDFSTCCPTNVSYMFSGRAYDTALTPEKNEENNFAITDSTHVILNIDVSNSRNLNILKKHGIDIRGLYYHNSNVTQILPTSNLLKLLPYAKVFNPSYAGVEQRLNYLVYDFRELFSYCINLSVIVEDMFNSSDFTYDTKLYMQAFMNNTKITALPRINYFSKPYTLYRAFSECKELSIIPGNYIKAVLDNANDVCYLNYMFSKSTGIEINDKFMDPTSVGKFEIDGMLQNLVSRIGGDDVVFEDVVLNSNKPSLVINKSASNAFTQTIRTKTDRQEIFAETTDTTFVAGTTEGTMIIEWGDGTETRILGRVITADDLRHTYNVAGTYNVVFYHSMKLWFIPYEWNRNFPKNDIDTIGISKFIHGSIQDFNTYNQTMYPSSDGKSIAMLFGKEIQTLPFDLLYGLSDVSTITDLQQLFTSMTKLQYIPEGLLDKCVALTNANNLFSSSTTLTTIPDHFFDKCIKLSVLSGAFFGCSKLKRIPVDLFHKLPNLSIMNQMFQSTSLEIDETYNDLFLTQLSNYSANLISMFSGCVIKSLPGNIINRFKNSLAIDYMFNADVSKADLDTEFSIPSNFLPNTVSGFDGISYLSGLFRNRKKLISYPADFLIPLKILYRCDYLFQNTGITYIHENTIPAKFNNNINAQEMFSGCTIINPNNPIEAHPTRVIQTKNMLLGSTGSKTEAEMFTGVITNPADIQSGYVQDYQYFITTIRDVNMNTIANTTAVLTPMFVTQVTNGHTWVVTEVDWGDGNVDTFDEATKNRTFTVDGSDPKSLQFINHIYGGNTPITNNQLVIKIKSNYPVMIRYSAGMSTSDTVIWSGVLPYMKDYSPANYGMSMSKIYNGEITGYDTFRLGYPREISDENFFAANSIITSLKDWFKDNMLCTVLNENIFKPLARLNDITSIFQSSAMVFDPSKPTFRYNTELAIIDHAFDSFAGVIADDYEPFEFNTNIISAVRAFTNAKAVNRIFKMNFSRMMKCNYMYENCTEITSVPYMYMDGAKYLQTCEGMFEGCINLSNIGTGANILTGNIDFILMKENIAVTSMYGPFEPETTHRDLIFGGMFQNCTSLPWDSMYSFMINSSFYKDHAACPINMMDSQMLFEGAIAANKVLASHILRFNFTRNTVLMNRMFRNESDSALINVPPGFIDVSMSTITDVFNVENMFVNSYGSADITNIDDVLNLGSNTPSNNPKGIDTKLSLLQNITLNVTPREKPADVKLIIKSVYYPDRVLRTMSYPPNSLVESSFFENLMYDNEGMEVSEARYGNEWFDVPSIDDEHNVNVHAGLQLGETDVTLYNKACPFDYFISKADLLLDFGRTKVNQIISEVGNDLSQIVIGVTGQSLDMNQLDTSKGLFEGTSITHTPKAINYTYSVSTFIAKRTFANCAQLTNITIGNWEDGGGGQGSGDVLLYDTFMGPYGNAPDSFEETFMNCTSLTTIPDHFLWQANNVGNATEMFMGCTSLSVLPTADWFATKNYNWFSAPRMFKGCTSLIDINPLFTYMDVFLDMTECFYGCSGIITEIPPRMWAPLSYSNVEKVGPECFRGCPLATNYNDVPPEFGGPARYAVKIMALDSTQMADDWSISDVSTIEDGYGDPIICYSLSNQQTITTPSKTPTNTYKRIFMSQLPIRVTYSPGAVEPNPMATYYLPEIWAHYITSANNVYNRDTFYDVSGKSYLHGTYQTVDLTQPYESELTWPNLPSGWVQNYPDHMLAFKPGASFATNNNKIGYDQRDSPYIGSRYELTSNPNFGGFLENGVDGYVYDAAEYGIYRCVITATSIEVANDGTINDVVKPQLLIMMLQRSSTDLYKYTCGIRIKTTVPGSINIYATTPITSMIEMTLEPDGGRNWYTGVADISTEDFKAVAQLYLSSTSSPKPMFVALYTKLQGPCVKTLKADFGLELPITPDPENTYTIYIEDDPDIEGGDPHNPIYHNKTTIFPVGLMPVLAPKEGYVWGGWYYIYQGYEYPIEGHILFAEDQEIAAKRRWLKNSSIGGGYSR